MEEDGVPEKRKKVETLIPIIIGPFFQDNANSLPSAYPEIRKCTLQSLLGMS